jgi:hypothetical protein
MVFWKNFINPTIFERITFFIFQNNFRKNDIWKSGHHGGEWTAAKKKVFINCWTIFLLESQVGNGVKKQQTSAENQLLKNNRHKKLLNRHAAAVTERTYFRQPNWT